MTAVKSVRKLGGGFTKESEIIRAIYDFSKDGGAVGSLDLFQCSQDCVIEDFMAVVKTAGTSGGSATVEMGISGGTTDTDFFLTATAVASLTAGAMFVENGAFANKRVMASGDAVTMTIATAALTAGKIEVTMKVTRK